MNQQTFYLALLVSALVSACSQATQPINPDPITSQTTVTPSILPSVSTQIQTRIDIVQASSTAPSPTLSVNTQNSANSSPSPSPSSIPLVASPVAVPTATPTPVPTATPQSSNSSTSSGGGSSGGSVTITGVSIASVASTQLIKGQTLDLYAQVNLSNGQKSQFLTWSSVQPDIASVDANGLVTALQAGTVTIQAKSDVNPTKLASVSLTISHQVVSFNGKIVYISQDDLYIMKGSNQAPIRLTFTGEDRSKVLPRLSWNGELVTYRVDGDDYEILKTTGTDEPLLHELTPTDLSPKPYFWYGNNILYQDSDDSGDEFVALWRQKPNGETQGWSNRLGYIGNIAGITLTGDVVFEQGEFVKICKYNDNSTKRNIAAGFDPKVPKNPNPTYVIYTNPNQDIMRAKLYSDEVVQLTPTDTILEGQADMSPDETQVVFTSTRDGGKRDIFIMNADGSNVRNLTNTPDINEFLPDWSN